MVGDDVEIANSWVRLEDFQIQVRLSSCKVSEKRGSSQVVTGAVLVIESSIIKLANGAQENREKSMMRVKND